MSKTGAIITFFPQVRALTVANLKSRYRKTLAGFLWVLINPLIVFAVQSLVFKKFLRLEVPNYSLFLLSGLLPWIFITQSLEMCTSIFVSASQLLKSFQLPPLVYLFAQLFDNLINFVAAFLIILLPVLLTESGHNSSLLLLPLAVLPLVFGVVGMAWLLATAQVFFRDTRFVISFVLSIAFFLTPVFYPESFVPEQYRWLINVNVFYILIRPFRYVVTHAGTDELLRAFGTATMTACLLISAATLVWVRKKNAIYFNL
jgi:ABC-type polysaccharide/polyol phosphate export permease